jgi:hypothetical protein
MAEQQPDLGDAAPTLSVVLPNYNHGRYLPRALDALLAQSRPADEIIVIDDASTDDSRDIIARYAAKNLSIRPLLNDKNIGVIATLTRGLNVARGTYVYFGAADDFVLPRFFATGLAALQAYPNAGLFCGEMILVDGTSGKSLGARPPVRPRFRAGYISPAKFGRLLRYNDNFILTGAALIRRDAAVWAGGFDKGLSTFADAYLVRKIAFTYGLCYAPQPCLTWCIFPDGVSRTTSTNVDRTQQVFKSIQSRMTADPVFPKWYWNVFERRWRFSICRLATQEDPINIAILESIQGKTGLALTKWAIANLGGHIARLLILALLWCRLRPYSIVGLLSTALARRFAAT